MIMSEFAVCKFSQTAVVDREIKYEGFGGRLGHPGHPFNPALLVLTVDGETFRPLRIYGLLCILAF